MTYPPRAPHRSHNRHPQQAPAPQAVSPQPVSPQQEQGSPQRAEGSPQRSNWWLGLLALLPIACCGLPVLLAAGVSVGTGALLGGITGAVLLVLGVVLVVVAVRRTRAARRGTGAGTDRDRCC